MAAYGMLVTSLTSSFLVPGKGLTSTGGLQPTIQARSSMYTPKPYGPEDSARFTSTSKAYCPMKVMKKGVQRGCLWAVVAAMLSQPAI